MLIAFAICPNESYFWALQFLSDIKKSLLNDWISRTEITMITDGICTYAFVDYYRLLSKQETQETSKRSRNFFLSVTYVDAFYIYFETSIKR